MKNLLGITILLGCAQGIFSEIIQANACTSPTESNPISRVLQVRVDPCPFPGNGQSEPCKLKRGTIAKISVDFFPKQSVSSLRASLVYLRKNSELPLLGLERDGCKSLTYGKCPLSPNSMNTWSTEVNLRKSYPTGIFPLKLKLTEAGNQNAPATVLCQTFSIMLY